MLDAGIESVTRAAVITAPPPPRSDTATGAQTPEAGPGDGGKPGELANEGAYRGFLLNRFFDASLSPGGSGGAEPAAPVGPTAAQCLPTQPCGSTSDILENYQVADDEMVDWEPPFPFSLKTEPRRITKTEAGLLDSLSPLNQWDFKNIHDQAFAESEARYPGESSREANDGHQDAFRHAYWNARMVREFGEDFAKKFATAHEGAPNNPADREAMDLYNNEVGRRIAVENPDAGPEELAQLVQEAVERGDLIVIDAQGELACSDQVAFGQHGQADDPPAAGGQPAEPADSDDASNGTGS